MNINAIQEQLESLGYSAISSQDNFENSVKCDACLPKNLSLFKPFGYLNITLEKRLMKLKLDGFLRMKTV